MHRPTFSLGPIAIAAVLIAASGPAPAGEVLQVPDGFDAVYSTRAASGGLAVLPDGRIARFDAASVLIDDAGGSGTRALFTIDDPKVFGTFLRLDPEGASLWLGLNYPEASTSPHSIYRLALDPGEEHPVRIVETVTRNYDLAFDSRGRPFVSAFEGTQMIALLDGDPSTPADPVVKDIPGYSGPIAFRDGKLYCATASLDGTNRIAWFTEEQLEAGIGDGNSIAFQTAIDAGQVIVERTAAYAGLAFVGETLLASGDGRIEAIAPGGIPETFATLVPGEGGFPYLSYLAFRPGTKAFEAGSGPAGGTLVVSASDFGAIAGIVEVSPHLWFQRGRINADGEVDISDAIGLLSFLFTGGEAPEPIEAADINDDGRTDIADPIFLLSFLFQEGERPPEPFLVRGPDPTP